MKLLLVTLAITASLFTAAEAQQARRQCTSTCTGQNCTVRCQHQFQYGRRCTSTCQTSGTYRNCTSNCNY